MGLFIFARYKMKLIFVVLLLIALPACFATTSTYNIDSVNGADNSTDCSDSEPCASVMGALNAYIASNTTNDIAINVAAGTYTGVNNIGITFPGGDIEISIEGSAEDEVIFDGNNSPDWIFTAVTSFDVSDITFQNAAGGVIITSEDDLDIESTTFFNIGTGVSFNGEDISLDSVSFNSTDVGVYVTDAVTIDFEGCNFVGESTTGISIQITTTNVTEITFDTLTFENTGGISVSVSPDTDFEDNDLQMNDIEMTGITSAVAISLTNGRWTIEDSPITTCTTAISYTGSGNFTEVDINSVDIIDCTVNVTDTGFTSTLVGFIEIENNSMFFGATNPIHVSTTTYFQGEFDSITFEETGTILFDVGTAGTNFTMSDVTITSPTARAIQINGGLWGFSDVDITGPLAITGDGAGFHLSGVGSTYAFDDCDISELTTSGSGGAIYLVDGALALDECNFTNCTANTGGAVYAVDYSAFSIKDTDFEYNTAVLNGGAVDAESSTTNGTNIYVESTDFSSNRAYNGAAISCCSLSVRNITVMYNKDGTATFENNNNTIGSTGADVTCQTNVGDFQTAATDPQVDSPSTSSDWLMWLIIILAILLVIGLVVAAGVGVYFYKKRTAYTQID